MNRFICYLLTEESAHNVFVGRVRNKFIKKKKSVRFQGGGFTLGGQELGSALCAKYKQRSSLGL